ncbi:MAG: hypothetical protein ABWY25_10255 [Paenisporosarcina sp.]
MATTAISIGPQFTMTQNIVFALPGVSVEVVQLSAAIETSLEVAGTFTATTSTILTGAFVRCTTGNATITLRKNGVG